MSLVFTHLLWCLCNPVWMGSLVFGSVMGIPGSDFRHRSLFLRTIYVHVIYFLSFFILYSCCPRQCSYDFCHMMYTHRHPHETDKLIGGCYRLSKLFIDFHRPGKDAKNHSYRCLLCCFKLRGVAMTTDFP